MITRGYVTAQGSVRIQTRNLISQPRATPLPLLQMHYAMWCFKTPILLTQFGMLSGMPWTELVFMLFWNNIMLAAGYGAQVATTTGGIWPLFTVGCVAQAITFYQLSLRWKRSYGTCSEDNLFAALFKIMFVMWKCVG